MLTWIAVANAVVWSGVIVFLLLRLMRGAKDIEARLERLEAEMGAEDDPAGR
jgi:hypothetical protein